MVGLIMTMAEPIDATTRGSLRLVGRVRLHDRLGSELPLPTRKTRALLALVALSPEGAATRSRLAGLLWGDRSDAQARASLRQSLHELRRALEPADLVDVLTVDRDAVALDLAALEVDVRVDPTLAERLALAALEARLSPWTADLMEDLDDIAPPLDDWLRDERATRRAALVRAVTARLAREAPSDHVLRLAQLVVAVDPSNEPAHRVMMQVHAAQQNVGGALAHYHRLENYFHREFGSEPHEATRGAAFGLAEGPAPTFREERRTEAARPPRLLLAKLSEVSGDEDLRALGDMLLDDLALMLERSQEVELVASESDDTATDVDLVLHASLRSTPATARGYLWLTRPRDRVRLWSERFDVPMEGRPTIDDHAIARMSTAVLSGVVRRMAAARTSTAEAEADAYRLFASARERVDVRPTRERLREALRLLQQAVDADPHNLIARIYLVRLLNTQLFETETGADPGPWRTRAREIATTAYEIDPRSAVANIVMGWCHLRQRDFGEARWFMEQALELNPYHPERQTDAATAFMYLGDHDRADACLAKAKAMAPGQPEQFWADEIEIRVMRGEYRLGLELAHHLQRFDLKRTAWLCVAAGHAGERERAEEARVRLVNLGRELWVGREPFSTEALLAWLLDHLPFAAERDEAVFRQGLRVAGLPC
jgi:DNA-binding SARP family transcriptional activator